MRDIPDVLVERPAEATAVVVLTGDHDISQAKELDALLAALLDETELLVVDLSEAQFIDSSVINTLVRTKNAASEAQTTFRVQLGSEAIVERTLEVSGVLEFLEAVSTRAAALAPADE